MIFSMIAPVAFVASVVLFLLRARAQARRRSKQTWGDLVARLEPTWNLHQLGDCLKDEEATPQQRWERLHGARGLYVMFQNAKVMLEIVDFAAYHSTSIDRNLLIQLRSDALQIRVNVVLALTQYALHQINEGICAKALRAAATYQNMTAQVAELLQGNGGQMAPAFVGAR